MQNRASKVTLYLFISLLIYLPSKVHAALLYSQAANQTVTDGQTFTVDWLMDTQGSSINSVDATLHFTNDTLQVVNAIAQGSGIDLWIKTPTFDNNAGTISLTGGIAGGASTSKLQIFAATFRAIKTGAALVSIDDASTVLLANGSGTPLKLSFAPLSFPVIAPNPDQPLVSSSTNPDENTWYHKGDVEITVAPKPGIQYSYSFSSNIDLIPDQTIDDLSKPLEYHNLPDGVYYFKLNSKSGNGNWTEEVVRRFQIDNTPPQIFTPAVGQDPSVFNGQPFVSYATADLVSGLAYYEVKFGSLDSWHKTNQTYSVLPKLRLGDVIAVRAVDNAGNVQLAQITYNQSNNPLNFSNWIFFGIIIVSVLVLAWLIRFVLKKLKKP